MFISIKSILGNVTRNIRKRIVSSDLRRRTYRLTARVQRLGLSVVPRKHGELWSYVDSFQCSCIREWHNEYGNFTIVGANPDKGIPARITHKGIFDQLPKNWLIL